jgi:hypothetical protein
LSFQWVPCMPVSRCLGSLPLPLYVDHCIKKSITRERKQSTLPGIQQPAPLMRSPGLRTLTPGRRPRPPSSTPYVYRLTYMVPGMPLPAATRSVVGLLRVLFLEWHC